MTPYKDPDKHREKTLAYHRQYYLDHVNEIKAKAKKYRAEHKEEIRARNARYRIKADAKIKRKNRRYHLAKKYNITPEEFDAMMERQNGVCLICGTPPKKKRLHIDHSHSNGKVRGLLCFHCNYVVIVALEHYQSRLPRAARYLEGGLHKPPKVPLLSTKP